MADLKAAVIGCGGHAEEHLRMIATDPRLHLAAVADKDVGRLEQVRVAWRPEESFSDYRRLLDVCDLDLVHICTMPGHIVPIALDCLRRDLHTSIEKPPGMNSSETQQLAVAADLSRGKHMVSFNRRFFPEVLAVRRIVKERGGPVHCAATYNKELNLIGTEAWAHLTPPSIICDAIHHVDLLRWLAGSKLSEAALATEVYSIVEQGVRDGTRRHNAIIHFDSGATAVLMSHSGVGSRMQRAEVHAEDFSAYLNMNGVRQCDLYEAFDVNRDGTTCGNHFSDELDLELTGGRDFNETCHFVDCILTDRTPWTTLDDAVHTMRLGEAIGCGHKGQM